MHYVDLIAFYGFHFNDYFTTVLGMRAGAVEANPVLRRLVRSPFKFALFKFGLASIVPLYVCSLMPGLSGLVYVDTVVEALATWWNTFTIWRQKHGNFSD